MATLANRLKLSLCCIVVGVWSLFPVYWMLNLSFQTRLQVYSIPANLFPPTPTFNNWLVSIGAIEQELSWTTGSGLVPIFQEGMVHSLILGVVVTLITLAISIPAAYAFARYTFPFKNLVFFIILFGRSVPPISVVIPYYMLFGSLGLRSADFVLGQWIGLILMHVTLTVPLIMFVLTGFFGTIPKDFDRAARLDGCSRRQLFMRILLPTAAPGIAACAILTFLTSWNEMLYGLIIGGTAGFHTLPAAIAAPLFGVGSDVTLMTRISSISLIPPIIAAIFLQRYITRLKIVDPVAIESEL